MTTSIPALFRFRASPLFESDGCSGYMSWAWEKVFGHLPPWDGVCRSHDVLYWSGGAIASASGPPASRAWADAFLFDGVAKHSRVWAWLMWVAVRAGGSQYLPFSWRWRYRERWLDVVRGKT